MFIIYCPSDNSHSKVNDSDVVYDDNVPNTGTMVNFFWQNSLFEGEVILHSHDKLTIDNKFRELQKTHTAKKIAKRRRAAPLETENENNIKLNKKAVAIDNKSKANSMTSPSRSPSKEELKKRLEQSNEKYKKLIKSQSIEPKPGTSKSLFKNSSVSANDSSKLSQSLKLTDELNSSNSSSSVSLSNDSDNDSTSIKKNSNDNSTFKVQSQKQSEKIQQHPAEQLLEQQETRREITPTYNSDDEDDQLLGRDNREKMVDIGQGIFCTKRKLVAGIASGEATILARHLMDGVFKKEIFLYCTFSGQTCRSQGETKKHSKMEALNYKARTNIINYALKYASEHGWLKKIKNGESVPYVYTDIQRSMTQKLGEIRRENQKNKTIKEDNK